MSLRDRMIELVDEWIDWVKHTEGLDPTTSTAVVALANDLRREIDRRAPAPKVAFDRYMVAADLLLGHGMDDVASRLHAIAHRESDQQRRFEEPTPHPQGGYVDAEGTEHDSLTDYVRSYLGWCGCGHADESMVLVAKVLSILRRRHLAAMMAGSSDRGDDLDREWARLTKELRELVPDDPLGETLLQQLDAAGWLEHGSTIGGSWLSPDGELALAMLDRELVTLTAREAEMIDRELAALAELPRIVTHGPVRDLIDAIQPLRQQFRMETGRYPTIDETLQLAGDRGLPVGRALSGLNRREMALAFVGMGAAAADAAAAAAALTDAMQRVGFAIRSMIGNLAHTAIHHIDGDPTNNAIENLELVEAGENLPAGVLVEMGPDGLVRRAEPPPDPLPAASALVSFELAQIARRRLERFGRQDQPDGVEALRRRAAELGVDLDTPTASVLARASARITPRDPLPTSAASVDR